MRGIIPAKVMSEMEYRAGKPIHQQFDLIVGTSTGGILAVLAGSGVPMREAVKFYYRSGPKIFSGIGRKILSLGGLFATKYSGKPLEDELRKCIPLRPLGSALTHTMCTAVRGDNHADVIKSWDSWGGSWPAWEVAKATSSAQVYFPPHEYDGQLWYDGGNVRNNPVVCGLVEAIRMWGPSEAYQVMSITTGKKKDTRILPKGGAVSWIPELFETTSLADDSYDDYTMRQLQEILQLDYRRLDVTLDEFPAMDDASEWVLDKLSDAAMLAMKANPKFLNL